MYCPRNIFGKITHATAQFESDLYFKIHDCCINLNYPSLQRIINEVSSETGNDEKICFYEYTPPKEHVYSYFGSTSQKRTFIDIENAGNGYYGHSFLFTVVLAFSTYIKTHRPDKRSYEKVFKTFEAIVKLLFKCGYRPDEKTYSFVNSAIEANLILFPERDRKEGFTNTEEYLSKTGKLSKQEKKDKIKEDPYPTDFPHPYKLLLGKAASPEVVKDRWGKGRWEGWNEDLSTVDNYYAESMVEVMKLLQDFIIKFEFGNKTGNISPSPWEAGYKDYRILNRMQPISEEYYAINENALNDMKENSEDIIAFVKSVLQNIDEYKVHSKAEANHKATESAFQSDSETVVITKTDENRLPAADLYEQAR